MIVALILAACSLMSNEDEATSPPVDAPPPAPVEAPAGAVATGKREGKVYGDMGFRAPTGIETVSFGPGGDWLLARDYEGELHQFALPSGERMPTMQSPCTESYNSAMALSPDGKTLAIACDYDDIAIASVETGIIALKLAGSAETIRWSSDAKSIAIVDNDAVRVLDPKTGKVAWRGENTSETRVANHGDTWLFAGYFGEDPDDYDGSPSAVAVSASTGEVLWRHSEEYNVMAPALSLDGKRAVFSTDEAIFVKDARTGKDLRRRAIEGWFESIVPTADGWWGLEEDRIFHFDDDFSSEVITSGAGNALVSSPDGEVIVALGGSRLSVWNASGEPLHGTTGLPDAARWVDVSDNGEVFAASSEQSLSVVNRTSGDAIGVHLEWWTDVLDLSPDGKHLAYAGEESVFVIDVQSGRTTRVAIEDSIDFLAFTPDSRSIIAIAGYDELNLLRISADPARVVSREQIASGEGDYARLSADGRALVVPGRDGTTRIYDVADHTKSAQE